MKYYLLLLFPLSLTVFSCKNESKDRSINSLETSVGGLVTETSSAEKTLRINPISHATMILSYGKDDIYVDPTGGPEVFEGFSVPEIVLITDIHGDHMDFETLKALDLSNATVIGPKAVVDQFPEDLKIGTFVTLNNGDSITINGHLFEAIPMYNLREEALKYHSKGRGNGYILTIDGERIYISGDTEDIPEMRALKNIDKAFVCMNLPYTMTVKSAVSAVLEFKPKQIYPYHYRGTDGFSDVENFKTLVNQADKGIEVVQLNWYQK
ncbi:MBL fold metallo-hydrolase [Psychroserpens burtonensis]|uniref:MBL fold metallo-hydrolase n=1 Tax=Psychroserpens burtonensis TaxID=49278 RepID=A0A5C7B7X4_9FLAO|nr:MBL fold metallo-hydrolase [Psychroserpens burtonensis]TXE17308.1 MBL fold metallo-hydrolase [Psychroserpens burtonensis]